MNKLFAFAVAFVFVVSFAAAQNTSSQASSEEKSKKAQTPSKQDSPLVQAAKKEQERRDKVKSTKTFTNQDIQAFKEKNKGTGWDDSSAEQTEDTDTADVQQETTPSEPDLANDEQYWRNKHSEAVERLNTAKQNAERYQSEFNALQRAFYAEADGIAQRGKIGAEANERLTLLEEAKREVAAATQAIEDLEEEARRAGAPPGWVRE